MNKMKFALLAGAALIGLATPAMAERASVNGTDFLNKERFQVRAQLHLLPEQLVLHFEHRTPVPLRDHHAGFQPLRLVHQLFVLRQHFLCCHSPFCIQIPPPYFLSGIFLCATCYHGTCAHPA